MNKSDYEFYKALRNIQSSSDISFAEALIEAVETNDIDEDMERFGIPKNKYNSLMVRALYNKIEKLTEEIDALREYCDKDLDSFINDIQSNITDYTTAMDSYYMYDTQFFYDLPFSPDGKKKVASAILESCSYYMKEAANPVWMNVINNKSLMAPDISDPVNAEDQVKIENGPVKDQERNGQ